MIHNMIDILLILSKQFLWRIKSKIARKKNKIFFKSIQYKFVGKTCFNKRWTNI